MTDIEVYNCLGKRIQTIRFTEEDTEVYAKFIKAMGLQSGKKEYTWNSLVFKLLKCYKIKNDCVKSFLYGCIKYSLELKTNLTMQVV